MIRSTIGDMIGQATAGAERAPRRWIQRAWGSPYYHKRLDWGVVWPALAALPPDGLRVLDAGCGAGHWSLELAARRPDWDVVGIDRDARALHAADVRRRRLALRNVSFAHAEFEAFATDRPFDVVLSVCAAHYAVERGRGAETFARAASLLKPGGLLLLYGPRRRDEVPFARWLPSPAWHTVYSQRELRQLCAAAALQVESLTPCVGSLGTAAGQLGDAVRGPVRRIALAAGLYGVQLALLALDQRTGAAALPSRSLMWLLAARRPA